MQNLDQIRAKHALHFWKPEQGQPPTARGVNQGDVISKLPSLIISNGLLATLAFAKSKGAASGHFELMREVFRFLCSEDRRALPAPPARRNGDDDLDPYICLLTEGNEATSIRLQIATAEALAYLGYLKRFAP
jgi:CRISPR/Cas system CMR-associated protein Cmr5 small subunit